MKEINRDATSDTHEVCKHTYVRVVVGKLKTHDCMPPSTDLPEIPDASALNDVVVSKETLRFDYPDSDIILRSSDSHDFRVPKLYIVNSSPAL